ncbi:ras GTPase-activating protein-binding protein 1-like isoform X2 [Gordionus sp. m RMFG-2023]|uniref:ras GTPase-activating protein-binding protein 1-like isoform X2 n=1 Tax=Gordionus sp. m RMFG-2023 TaxID=3053472 RepID=UPI0031FDB491
MVKENKILNLENENDEYEQPNPQCVGSEFVKQYYTTLSKIPDFLFRFYTDKSSFVHGGIGQDDEELPVIGQKAIYKKIQSLQFRDCRTKIRKVDSHPTLSDGIVLQVAGEISNNSGPMRRFMQTFVLGFQKPRRYYVINDIFRYQDEIFDEHEESNHNLSPSIHSLETRQNQNIFNNTEYDNETSVDNNKSHISNNLFDSSHQNVLFSNNLTTISKDIIHESPSKNIKNIYNLPIANSTTTQYASFFEESSNLRSTQEETLTNINLDKNNYLPSQNHLLTNGHENWDSEEHDIKNNDELNLDELLLNKNTNCNQEKFIELSDEIQDINNGPTKTYAQLLSKNKLNEVPQYYNQNFANSKKNERVDQIGKNNNISNVIINEKEISSLEKNDLNSNNVNAKQNNTFSKPFKAPQQSYFKDNNKSYPVNDDAHKPVYGPQLQLQSPQTATLPQPNIIYPDSHQIFVGNLPHTMGENELSKYFSEYGKVVDLKIISGQKDGTRKVPNYGFVIFSSSEPVKKLINEKPIIYKGHRLNVEEKKNQRKGGGPIVNNRPNKMGPPNKPHPQQQPYHPPPLPRL